MVKSQSQFSNASRSATNFSSKPVGNGKDREIIDTYMENTLDFPGWYRGISALAIKAAHSLHFNLRDDSQQGTTHRVRNALRLMGVHPLPKQKKIRIAMELSRGNDIAFLWFLMELYYRCTCDNCQHDLPTGYTLNEQIIMTAIAYLDMIPTLRELDKILPKQAEKPKKEKVKKKERKPQPNYILPYFAKQPQPVEYGKTLNCRPLDKKLNLSAFQEYLNPKYRQPNESNRWFAQYKLNKKKRVSQMFREDELGDANEKRIHCEFLATTKVIRQSFIKQLDAKKWELYKKCFDSKGRLKDHTYNRIIYDLKQRIDEAKKNLDKTFNIKTKEGLRCRDGIPIRPKQKRKVAVSKQAFYDEYFNKYDSVPEPIYKNTYFEPSNTNMFNNTASDPSISDDTIRESHESLGESLNESLSESPSESLDRPKTIEQIQLKEYEKVCAREDYISRSSTTTGLPESGKKNSTYYDPYNPKVMEKLLIDAINEIQKNKKFVLVTFPDAHKVPILKTFVKNRYGFVSTKKKLIQDFKVSSKIFLLLNKSKYNLRMPSTFDLTKKVMVSYGCSNYLSRKQSYKRVKKFINEGIEKAQEDIQKSARYPCLPLKNKNRKVSIIDSNVEETIGDKKESNECYSKYDVLPKPLKDPIYFEAPTEHTPYKFNYDKIFDIPKDNIRETIYEILKEEGGGDLEKNHQTNPDDIIKKVFDDLWEEEVKLAVAKYNEEKKKVVKKPKKDIMDKYDLPYYDPYNADLMKNLLIDAMRVMRRNRKFVLVTFPDAHKTPVLKQFVMRRYGYLNLRKVARKDYVLSKNICHLLKKSNYFFHVPSPRDIAEKDMVNYGCRDYIDKKTEHLKHIYQHNFKQTLLEDIRNYWGAVRPYICTNGPPRKQFFAYLPARENDIHLFRPWKSDEYIRAKEQWDRQQVINRMKEQI